jgi:hypothetical protein
VLKLLAVRCPVMPAVAALIPLAVLNAAAVMVADELRPTLVNTPVLDMLAAVRPPTELRPAVVCSRPVTDTEFATRV